jgi:hypothetical protein
MAISLLPLVIAVVLQEFTHWGWGGKVLWGNELGVYEHVQWLMMLTVTTELAQGWILVEVLCKDS